MMEASRNAGYGKVRRGGVPASVTFAFTGLALALITLGTGCDKPPWEADPPVPADPSLRGTPPPQGRAKAPVDLDGAVVLERADPLPPAGDLREEVTNFTSLDACVAQHAVLDPLVGDAVRSIGYDTLLRDACRILQAIKQKDTAACGAITASSLERRCESLVAIALQDPERCPWEMESQKRRGREAMCLAVSTRDPRTCGAAVESQQPTCEALASGDAARCAKTGGDERGACTREVARYRTLLAEEHDAHDTATPRAHLEVHGATETGTKDPPTTDFDLSSSVVGGAVVAAEAVGGAEIELARDLESSLRLPMRIEKSHLETSVVFEAGAPKVTKLSIRVPKLAELACPSAHCTLNVTMPKADPKRGAPLSATIEGTVETPSGTYRVKLQIDTFVRDVVGRAALYGGR
jgi:hypothetical protein